MSVLDPALDLDEREQKELHSLADRLSKVSPGLLDDPTWLAAASAYSCRIPVRLREALRLFRSDPGPNGLLRVRGLPAESARPTPMVKDSVERATTVPAAALILCATALGEVVGFRSEKSGAAVQNVVPVPGRERSQSNAGSRTLEMHVENAFHPHRPDLVALSCLRTDHDGIGGLQIASVRAALGRVAREHRRVLAEPRFRTDPPPSFGGAGQAVVHSVLTGADDDPDVRVDFASTRPLDDEAATAMEELRDALCSVRTTVVLAPGDLAIVDNRIALHGRTAFTPRYDGRDRWLQRAFVHLDPRRSRPARTYNGHVLD